MKINVSSIQHFSTGDGDGIRTTVFLKGCNLRCPWCHNPETIPNKPTVLHYSTGDVTNGFFMDIDDIVAEAMEDIDFYQDGGGVTISGGEPMLQAKEVSGLIQRLKEKGISVIVDTAGSVPYSNFELVKDMVDTFFIDLKAADGEGYKEVIGGNFDLVCDNIKNLIEDGKKVRIRIPLIPGFNDSPDYSKKMCRVLKNIGISEVDLLPFHRLGTGKYDALGIPYAYSDTEPMSIEKAREIAGIYSTYFSVRVEK